jgi:hypothetical protein
LINSAAAVVEEEFEFDENLPPSQAGKEEASMMSSASSAWKIIR